MSEWIEVRTADGTFRTYVARPAKPWAPCVVVLQEILGVNADIRTTCDELAADGYLALAPDLFWRMKPGLDITDATEAEWKQGFDLYNAFDLEKGVADVMATMAAGRVLRGASGKVAVMGFCLGGLLAFIAASRSAVEAAVVYHGGNTELHLSEAITLSSPLLMHIGEEDEYISKDAQRRIQASLGGLPEVDLYLYPGARHAFARHGGQHYDAASAALANGRTREFLEKHLR